MPFESPAKDAWEAFSEINLSQIKDEEVRKVFSQLQEHFLRADVSQDPAIHKELIDDNAADIATNVTAIGLNTTHSSSDGSDHSIVGDNTTAIALNTTHRTSDGSDHTFIDQDVTTAGTPSFSTTNVGGLYTDIKEVDASPDYTFLTTDTTVLFNITAARTAELPAASGLTGKIYHIKLISSGFTLTINGNLGDLIDGSGTQALASQYGKMTIQSDGADWHILE